MMLGPGAQELGRAPALQVRKLGWRDGQAIQQMGSHITSLSQGFQDGGAGGGQCRRQVGGTWLVFQVTGPPGMLVWQEQCVQRP